MYVYIRTGTICMLFYWALFSDITNPKVRDSFVADRDRPRRTAADSSRPDRDLDDF